MARSEQPARPVKPADQRVAEAVRATMEARGITQADVVQTMGGDPAGGAVAMRAARYLSGQQSLTKVEVAVSAQPNERLIALAEAIAGPGELAEDLAREWAAAALGGAQ